MKELKSYIFIDITEIAIKDFHKSKFMTFTSYCVNYGLSVLDGKTPSGDRSLLTEVYDYLKDVYCLTNDEIGDYLLEYFTLPVETLHSYQKVSVNMKKYYPNSYL